MQKVLLLFFFLLNYSAFSQNPNLVSNGTMEVFANANSTPTGWSSSSDFGTFNQNTSDFIEGTSSVQFNPQFSDLFMFTLVNIPLEAGKTYQVKYSYKYLGTDFDENTNLEFKIISLPTVSNPFVYNTNFVNNNWNTVETTFTPTITNAAYSVEMKVKPGSSFNYVVLVDNVQIVETSALSSSSAELEHNMSLISLGNNQFKIKKSTDIVISEVALYSILGTKQPLKNKLNSHQELNLNGLASGFYIVHVSTNKGKLSKKILVK